MATRQLALHSAIAGVGILLLLHVVTGNWRNLSLILSNLPFALVGGVLAVDIAKWIGGEGMTMGSLVGFVTLFGITTRNSIMLLSHYEHLVRKENLPWSVSTATSPRFRTGSASASPFSRLAWCSFSLRPARLLISRRRPFTSKAPTAPSPELRRFDCYRLKRQFAGWDSVPTGLVGLFTAHAKPGLGFLSRLNLDAPDPVRLELPEGANEAFDGLVGAVEAKLGTEILVDALGGESGINLGKDPVLVWEAV